MSSSDKRRIEARFVCVGCVMRIGVGVSNNNNTLTSNSSGTIYQQCDSAESVGTYACIEYEFTYNFFFLYTFSSFSHSGYIL